MPSRPNSVVDWTEPLVVHPLTVAFLSTYSGLLFWSLQLAIQPISPAPLFGTVSGSRGIGLGFVVGGMGLLTTTIRRRVKLDRDSATDGEFRLPIGYYYPVAVFAIYFSGYWIWIREFTRSLSLIAFLQAGMLVTLLAVSSRPILPPVGLMPLRERVAYLQSHLTNWYRVTEIVSTTIIASGVGLATSVYLWNLRIGGVETSPGDPIGGIATISLITLVGVILLLIYTVVKFHVVGREIKDSRAP